VLVHGRASTDRVAAGLETLRRTRGVRLRVLLVEETVDAEQLRRLEGREFVFLASPPPASHPVDVLRESLASLPSADVVLVQAGAVIEDGWYDVLHAAAYVDSTTATASAARVRTPGGTFPAGIAGDVETEPAPAIVKPEWGCVYLRRDAIELALALHANGVSESASLTTALDTLITAPGLVHRMAATATLVEGFGASIDGAAVSGGVRRLLDIVEARGDRLRVMIDLRCCAYPMSGTQVQALQLVNALARIDQADVAVLLPKAIHRSVSREVSRLPSSIRRHTAVNLPSRRPHVFHCPYLLVDQQLGEAVTLGDRLVITHQDMIMSHTPSYFHNWSEWRRYTEMVEASFLIADHVAFFSEHAMADALSEGVVSPEKASVVPLGTDHLSGSEPGEVDSATASRLGGGAPFLLVIGNAYLHKNRIHALQLFTSLRRNERWIGTLVFAGGHPPFGGSAAIERRYLDADPGEAEYILDLGSVSESLKAWLYRNASMVLYPTLSEGFGLVPFEAAAFGTPVAYSRRSALADFLPETGALLEGWNSDVSARRIASVLGDPAAGRAIVDAVQESGRLLTWERTARDYLGIYKGVLRRRAGFSLALGGLAIGPEITTMTPTEQLLIKIYRRNSILKSALDSVAATASAGRRWAEGRKRHVS
jgi:glycosyltransferase involved in cell wall biosynthesis